jgi:hypothetical protein
MINRALLLIFFAALSPALACDDWFQNLKITDPKKCESKCRTAQTDMATYLCPQQCDVLCKSIGKPELEDTNLYGLTDDEIKFCSTNKIICLKAYKLTWEAESLCKEIYAKSRLDDESDACRHYVWAFLLSKEFGVKNAETILDAHESTPSEPEDKKAMDLANNRLGLIKFSKFKPSEINSKAIMNSFKENLKANKFIILNPRYKANGGLP